MPHAAAPCHRSASAPPLGVFVPLRPTSYQAAHFCVGAPFCALCAASRLCLVWAVRSAAQPRALRATGPRCSHSSAPVCRYALTRLTCGAVFARSCVCSSPRRGLSRSGDFSAAPRPSSLLCARRAASRRVSRAALPRPRRTSPPPRNKANKKVAASVEAAVPNNLPILSDCIC